MGYVSSNLLPGERVIHQADMHWFVFVPGAVILLLGLILLKSTSFAPLGAMGLMGGLLLLIRAVIIYSSTELAVTNRRVIAKTGIIRLKTVELNLEKMESLTVDQSIFGQLFNFGTIFVLGTGGGKVPICSIDSPMQFKQSVLRLLEH